MIPLDTEVKPYGKVQMIGYTGGERYYWLVNDYSVSMLPASLIEHVYEKQK